MNTLEKALLKLIEIAKAVGLSEFDVNNATEYLINKEYGLSYDTIITQMYEYDLEIDNEIYLLISQIAKKMSIADSEYLFMNELIRNDSSIPKPVREEIAKIIEALKDH